MANRSHGLANWGSDPPHLSKVSKVGIAMVNHRPVVTKQVPKDGAGPRSGQEIKAASQGQDEEGIHPDTAYLETEPRDGTKVRT